MSGLLQCYSYIPEWLAEWRAIGIAHVASAKLVKENFSNVLDMFVVG